MGMTIDTNLLYESGYNKGFKDGIKGSIPKADYENRLKADMVAMLTDLQLEIEESPCKHSDRLGDYSGGVQKGIDIIQQKINALKGENNGNR